MCIRDRSNRSGSAVILLIWTIVFSPWAVFPQTTSSSERESRVSIVHDLLQVAYPQLFGKNRFMTVTISQPLDGSWSQLYEIRFEITPLPPDVAHNPPPHDPHTVSYTHLDVYKRQGEGWGREGVSFGDLQLRTYVTDLSSAEILGRISGPAFATAKRYSSQAELTTGQEGEWERVVIQYDLFYGDYGGRANIEFYIRPVGQYRLVMVFMGNVENEKRQILDSVAIGRQSEPPH